MAVTVEHITFDAHDAARLARFWAAVLEREVDPDAGREFATIGRTAPQIGGATALQPVWMFIRVPEPRAGKNRIHVDLASPDRRADVERALAAGATHVADFAEDGTAWTTLRDIEGNVFDIGDGLA
jgi:hypothetical protein